MIRSGQTFDTATWKDEADGYGPLTLIDSVAAAQDPLTRDAFGMPFGYQPDWRHDHEGWVTLAEAREVAAEHGITTVREG